MKPCNTVNISCMRCTVNEPMETAHTSLAIFQLTDYHLASRKLKVKGIARYLKQTSAHSRVDEISVNHTWNTFTLEESWALCHARCFLALSLSIPSGAFNDNRRGAATLIPVLLGSPSYPDSLRSLNKHTTAFYQQPFVHNCAVCCSAQCAVERDWCLQQSTCITVQ